MTMRCWLALVLLCASMVAWGAGRPDDRNRIKVSAVSSVTGLGASSDAWRAAKAYFDAINATGGIRGQRIDYSVEDDRTDPSTAAAIAKRLAADTGVVALVGGSSVLDCAVNHRQYEQAGLMSIPGGGVDPFCFSTPNIAPVNAGPYVSMANALSFARTVLHFERLCVVAPALPGMLEAFQAEVKEWARRSGVSEPPMEIIRQLDDPVAPVMARVAERRCQVVVYTGPEQGAIAWARQARSGLPGVGQVFLTSAYTTSVAQALGAAGDGIYAMAEFEPWSSSSLQVSDWRGLMLARGVPPSSLSQGGYLAAQMFVKAVRSIPGPVTREAVTQALRAMAPVANSLTHEAYVVGTGDRHGPNRSAIPMRLVAGRWRVAHHEWIRYAPP